MMLNDEKLDVFSCYGEQGQDILSQNSYLTHIMLEVLASTVRLEKETKCILTDKEEIKLLWFADDRIADKNPKESPKTSWG